MLGKYLWNPLNLNKMYIFRWGEWEINIALREEKILHAIDWKYF